MNRLFFIFLPLLISCDNHQSSKSINRGQVVFAENCSKCHGKNAEGETKNWRKPLANGTYPAPPLNGSAHTWHHPRTMLKNVIINGGAKVGGQMPPFGKQLTNTDIEAVLDYLYSIWPKNIKQQYDRRF